jgi:tRNA dimethylallyltransferase
MFNFLKKIITQKPKIIVICGPTATGKTTLALTLAKKYSGEIISADSRQIYQGLDIGSGKITYAEMQGIRHHMIDVVHPKEIFSVQQYVVMSEIIIREILQRKKTIIICGGTGMYIDSVVYGIDFPKVLPNHALRTERARKSNSELFSLLKEKDPRRAQTIDPHNPVRLIRALEVIDALGVVPEIQKKSKYQTLYIGLDMPKEELNERIQRRVIDRFRNQNMLQEAKDRYADGLSYERMESLGLEYRYMAYHLQGRISHDEMISKLTTRIIQFAKRQRTWFKRNKKIHWFNPIIKNTKIETLVARFLKK